MRLLKVMLNEKRDELDSYLKSNGLELSQGAYDVGIDIFYNRGSNDLTYAIVDAMAERDDKKTQELLDSLDYDYAMKYKFKDTDHASQSSQAWVNDHPGFKIRRAENYNMYKNGSY